MIKKSFTKQDLQFYAHACLSYLTSDVSELTRFMDFAGYDPQTLRNSVGSDPLALALMEYFAKNEVTLLAMCANSQIDIESFMGFWQNQNRHE